MCVHPFQRKKTREKEYKLRGKLLSMGYREKVPGETYFFFPLVVFDFFGLQYLASSPAIMSSKAPCLSLCRFSMSCFKPSSELLPLRPISFAISSASAASF